MGRKIYKYFGPELVGIVLSKQGATFKCSLPKDFNDPYELFLTVDFTSDASALASYQEAIGAIPQLPTTCFSNSPAVTPMWAHYGNNVSGFVVEIDEDELLEALPESRLEDVTYRDEPDEGLTEMLNRVHHIGKPRYTYFLQMGTFHAAYFTKSKCWSYEMERRLVVDETAVRKAGELLLVDIPRSCITAIIVGARADATLTDALSERAQAYGCPLYRMQIGKTSIAPYFLNRDGYPYRFDGTTLMMADSSCESCSEPIAKGNDRCSWCQISEEDRHEAAIRNPYRILDRIGQLDAYIQSMNDISKGTPGRRGKTK